MNESERLARTRDSIDADPGTPGVQYYEDHQEYNRGYRDGDARGKHRWLFLGFLAGAAVMFVLRLFL